MTPDRAAAAVTSTRRAAETAARRDLGRLQAQALEAARRRAVQMFPLTPPMGARAVVNVRGGQVLRHWYTEVFSATLRNRLGEQVQVPAAAEIDKTATVLRRALADPAPDLPLRLAGGLHGRAVRDAAAAGNSLHSALVGTAHRRAEEQSALQAITGEARTAILEHWHQRCYLAAAHAQLGVLPPLQTVTTAEAREVTASVDQGQARQLIGDDGVPLVTTHGTAMTDVDRRLAAGETGVVEPPEVRITNPVLRRQVVGSWTGSPWPGGYETAEDTARRRTTWAVAAGVPAAAAERPWDQLTGSDQARLIGHWLDTHRNPQARLTAGPAPADPPFAAAALTGPPREAAAAMFNHTPPSPPRLPSPAAVSFPVSAAGTAERPTVPRGRDRRSPPARNLQQDLGR